MYLHPSTPAYLLLQILLSQIFYYTGIFKFCFFVILAIFINIVINYIKINHIIFTSHYVLIVRYVRFILIYTQGNKKNVFYTKEYKRFFSKNNGQNPKNFSSLEGDHENQL